MDGLFLLFIYKVDQDVILSAGDPYIDAWVIMDDDNFARQILHEMRSQQLSVTHWTCVFVSEAPIVTWTNHITPGSHVYVITENQTTYEVSL